MVNSSQMNNPHKSYGTAETKCRNQSDGENTVAIENQDRCIKGTGRLPVPHHSFTSMKGRNSEFLQLLEIPVKLKYNIVRWLVKRDCVRGIVFIKYHFVTLI